ncbi:aldo/keto reductase [Leptospira noguchii]|uniref:aldo/keto reductase n=1 Tax=Leptospira noguchii TaxID=28182 RepID=UPI001F069710|nr:aldo/keto reductase [Leptospira noguchii]MCH1913325.1 aldo/keto reductase [Leptospira noguchii]MCH1915412.1 aldo/keto reductase [Leptospira noguchii]UOG65261.1 aldo/keto reductase [Leptospira noguchii]
MFSKIAIGTAQFGLSYGVSNQNGQVSFNESKNIMTSAQRFGINTLDTAVLYGNSETVLGDIGVESWRVVTKIGQLSETDMEKQIHTELTNSLSRLKIKKLYALLLHRPEILYSKYGSHLLDIFNKLKDSGIIEKFGISIYSPDELERIPKGLKLEIVQAPLNVLDRRLEISGWLEKLKSGGCEIHVRSIFLQGLLLMTPLTRPRKFDIWKDLWKKWDQWLSESNLSALEACIGFIKTFSNVDKFVIGIESELQLNEIIQIMNSTKTINVPDHFSQNDEMLIFPSNWNLL